MIVGGPAINDYLCKWASAGIFGVPDNFDEKARALGVDKDGLIAAVIYTNYQLRPNKTPLSIEMSIYSSDPRWATRGNLKAFFAYPFIELKCPRIQTTCSAEAIEIIDFNLRLGFKYEGTHREAWPMGDDAITFSMLKNECRWING